MTIYGLIGYPLEHSFSARHFNEKFAREGIEARYENFPLKTIEEFPELIRHYRNLRQPMQPISLRGLNVTSPYKEAIIPHLDEIQEDAASIRAVNTIKIGNDGRLIGYNTDVGGFRKAVEKIVEKRGIKKALVVGTGGASKAVCRALKTLGVEPIVISRNPVQGQKGYADIDAALMKCVEMIVNATPVGMGNMSGEMPAIPYELVGPKHFCMDLIYNPAETLFLQECGKRGAPTLNGLEMLLGQAELAWAIWTATRP